LLSVTAEEVLRHNPVSPCKRTETGGVCATPSRDCGTRGPAGDADLGVRPGVRHNRRARAAGAAERPRRALGGNTGRNEVGTNSRCRVAARVRDCHRDRCLCAGNFAMAAGMRSGYRAASPGGHPLAARPPFRARIAGQHRPPRVCPPVGQGHARATRRHFQGGRDLTGPLLNEKLLPARDLGGP
jgi:hypothetical protein